MIAAARTFWESQPLELLIMAVEQSPASVLITDLEGRICYVNGTFSRVTGYAPAEVLGLTPSVLKSRAEPPETYATLWRTIQAGDTWRGEVWNRRKSGELYWDAVLVSPVRNADGVVTHYLAIQEDITDRHYAQAAVRRSEERFRKLVEHSSDVITLLDAEGRITYSTQSVRATLGYALDEMRGTPALDLVHPDDREVARRLLEEIAAEPGGRRAAGLRLRRKDGSWRDLDVVVVNRLDDEAIAAIVVTYHDVTELRSAEKQMLQAQKMEAVGRLAGSVAHDFNNLITVILAESDLLGEELHWGAEGRDGLEEIRKAALRAAALTKQLLAFSRRQLIEPVVFPVNEVIGEITTMIGRLIGEDVELITRLTPNAGAIKADRGQLAQVLTNLAVNARDAMPRGGTLTIETRNVQLDEAWVRAHPGLTAGQYVMLGVRDTGTGMSAEVLEQALEPFFTTKEVGRGTGLGLATCHGIVKRSGGEIVLESELGIGTTVRVFFPAETGVPESAGGRAQQVPSGNGETILVVEDEVAVRQVTVRLLTRLGYRVLEAQIGSDALRLLGTAGKHIDLLMTDVVLPGIGGRELADLALQRKPDLKVLFVSGYSDDVILQHRLMSHDVALLQKPFTYESLARAVQAALMRG